MYGHTARARFFLCVSIAFCSCIREHEHILGIICVDYTLVSIMFSNCFPLCVCVYGHWNERMTWTKREGGKKQKEVCCIILVQKHNYYRVDLLFGCVVFWTDFFLSKKAEKMFTKQQQQQKLVETEPKNYMHTIAMDTQKTHQHRTNKAT